ncbi:MAG: hypothetical protein Q4A63_00660 [Butyricicoccus pullicaecorum]|nr:hypothetical protein [Butyricicoccus pullicaecorum]MDO4668304.1 hypothetical protein [Butyricicoccus pullicaecorum]
MTHIEEFGKLLDDFSKVFDQLNTLQQEKIQAVHQDDLPALEHCMQREQAISLQIRGMQRQKAKVDEALGLQNVSFRQLSDHLSAEDQKQLAPVLKRFEAAYELYSSSAAASQAILETTLREIDHALEGASETAKPNRPTKHGSFTDLKA